jgi:hypothetical protein
VETMMKKINNKSNKQLGEKNMSKQNNDIEKYL